MPFIIFLYNVVFFILLLLMLPFLLFAAVFSPKYRSGFLNRFGFIPGAFKAIVKGRPNIWLHAASAGEVKCILPLVAVLKEKFPNTNIVFTTTGINGQRMLKKAAPDIPACYLPFDIYYFVKPLVRIINPRLLVIAETEYWPSLLYLVKKAGAVIIVVNGRFSGKAEKRYERVRPLIKKTLSLVDAFAMRTGEDAAFIAKLGVKQSLITVTGDLKFEKPLLDRGKSEALKAVLAPMLKEKVVVFGSVHLKEAGEVFGAFKLLKKKLSAVTLVLAPRFMEQIPDFVVLAEAEGFKYALRSKPINQQVELLILDSIGELAYAYDFCDLAFVGGSLVDGIGGHNLMEPVYFGKPVLFGSYAFNFKEMAEEVKLNLVGFTVKDAEDLAGRMLGILNDPVMLSEISKSSDVLLGKRRGSLEKTMDTITRLEAMGDKYN